MTVRESARNTCALIVLIECLAGGCGQQQPAVTDESTHSTHDVMTWMLDPAADHVWASAGQIITETETVDLAPTTDEGWDEVRHSATVVSEAGNILLMPAHARDQQDWMEISRGLYRAGVLAERAAETRDADALFEAGGIIYNVCVACHQLYADHLRF